MEGLVALHDLAHGLGQEMHRIPAHHERHARLQMASIAEPIAAFRIQVHAAVAGRKLRRASGTGNLCTGQVPV